MPSSLENTQYALNPNKNDNSNNYYKQRDHSNFENSHQYDNDLEVSTANNNSIVILLNNQDMYNSVVNARSNQGLARSDNIEMSLETIIPSLNQDPPITLEEALFMVSGEPDKYVIRNLYIILNLLSMVGFMIPLSMIFLFQEPKMECFNEEFKIYFRCSVQQACSKQYFNKHRQAKNDQNNNSFISYFGLMCQNENLSSQQLFAIISAVLFMGQFFFGFLMDKFGRKKIILVKLLAFGLLVMALVIIGFIGTKNYNIVLSIFFMALFVSTFFLDLQIIGFEQLQKIQRENFIILLSATRLAGILIVCACFVYLNKWVYFFCIVLGSILILGGIFMKNTFESIHYLLASTGQIDAVKYILNRIAVINDEDIITDKIAFSLSPQQIKKRRSLKFIILNLIGSKEKATVIAILSFCWLCYTTGQMIDFVFIEQMQVDLYLDLIILGCTEFMSALFTKIILKIFKRRTALLLLFSFICTLFFFLIILKSSSQTHYIVSISSRASLQILNIILTLTTLEQFPTEIRAFGFGTCLSFGMIGGMGLPFINQLSTELLIMIVLIFLTASIGIFFIRETKNEEQLRNIYTEIFPDEDQSQSPKKKSSSSAVNAEHSEMNNNQTDMNRQISIFDNIMNDLKGAKIIDEEKGDINQKYFNEQNEMIFEKDGPRAADQFDDDELDDDDYFDEEEMDENNDADMNHHLQNQEFEDDDIYNNRPIKVKNYLNEGDKLEYNSQASNSSTTRAILHDHSRQPSFEIAQSRTHTKSKGSSRKIKYIKAEKKNESRLQQEDEAEFEELTVGEIDEPDGLDQQYDRLNNI
ncbi:organic cation transporter [Stylonychia lemnae]|uniref:Organic cation transporter n=1 Tax=Stylonychia lemnae TaxID=5949 RepID=A0A078B2Z2_STYLE|nr:organic cation transporter [Stylonychia lemnae]|eukprot:CDW88626.1 organic cation transporter [Stylonychia lemnae]